MFVSYMLFYFCDNGLIHEDEKNFQACYTFFQFCCFVQQNYGLGLLEFMFDLSVDLVL